MFTGTVSLSDDAISIHEVGDGEAHSNQTDFPTDYLDIFYHHELTVTVTLSNPYDPADVIADCKDNLALIDLCDDKKYPWRTDVPVYNGNHYTPQNGPSYGPLVAWFADEADAAVRRGGMNPAGYEPFWDSEHLNELFGDTGGPGPCWYTNTRGAYPPAIFKHTKKWMPDLTNNMFLPGAHASFNSPPREYTICDGTTLVLDAGALYLSKWAETYLFEFPHQNHARPCGATDRATIDPDTIVCDPLDPGYNPTGDLRWPDAPCFCNDPTQTTGCETPTNPDAVNLLNTEAQLGSYSVKGFQFADTVATGMTCQQQTMIFTPCRPAAIFIQSEVLTGAYVDAVRIDPPAITVFDERRIDDDGVPRGHWALKQIHQLMVDPLWKQPKICEDDLKIDDPDAITPYVENTDCEDVNCASSPADPRCLQGNPLPWSYPQEVGI